ncbi:exonuclease domain-containing protein [Algiphilus sp.]|uniref:3'-5' exonuclease n=1 Tax=Algiphilus sp. TaxID=1872431 RepID=UPI003B52E181
MMRLPAPATRGALFVSVLCVAVAMATGLASWFALQPATRAMLLADARFALIPLLGLGAVALIGVGTHRLLLRHVGMVPRLTHALELLRETNPSLRLTDEAPQEIVRSINALAEYFQHRLGTVETSIQEATDALARERDLLAALLAQLRDAVLVCGEDGRILLYNPVAHDMLSRDQYGYVGLGRTVFTLFRRSVILHCLERLSERQARGESAEVRTTISTRDGRFLHARFTPLAEGSLRGFFLSMTPAEFPEQEERRPQEAASHTANDAMLRATHARAALALAREHPDMAAEDRADLERLAEAETLRLGEDLSTLRQLQKEERRRRWPLEEVPPDTLCDALRRRLEPIAEATVAVEIDPEVEWIRAESYVLSAGLRFVAAHARQQLNAQLFRIRLSRFDTDYVALDLQWQGMPIPADTWATWEEERVQSGDGALPYTLRQVARRHEGESWPLEEAGARWLLASAPVPPRTEASARSEVAQAIERPPRPEFMDFDLYPTGGAAAEHERPLRELIYTAFDTETTGLAPDNGDEIIAIGAIRVVQGRILSREVFESLVHSRQPIGIESRRVHGFSPAMLAEAPRAEAVLPQFARFCEDTVLLAHNAAFDLRFLERQGGPMGLQFDHPVLDTLLLSALLYPEGEGHQLEAIAARTGVSVVGRHTALGDAIVTAEIFVRLIPMLEAKGIETLGDALDASKKTWYARLRY